MTTHRDGSQRAKEGATTRPPLLRLDRVRLEELAEGRGWEVVVEGVNLRPVISPPAITVGGQPLEQVRFGPDGRSVRGVLPDRPPDLRVVVDYGFARAELAE